MTARETAAASLRDWRQRRDQLDSDRDPLVRAAVTAGLSDVEIREVSGLSRMTISQIRNPSGPLAVAEKARRALRSRKVPLPEIAATKRGEVWLSLPWEEQGQDADAAYMNRANRAGEVLAALVAAGIEIALPDGVAGVRAQEYLADPAEHYVLLSVETTPEEH